MYLKVGLSDILEKICLVRAIAYGLALLAGFSNVGFADPYQEATAGREPIVDLSYFGTHFHRLVLNPGEKNLQTLWPVSQIGAIRLWDSGTWWAGIAPKPGQWEYSRMDTYVYQANAHKAEVLYTLGGGTPRWASARPDEKCSYGLGCAAEPVKMAHWEEYVRRVVQRYRGRIKAYELWNEPNFSDIPRDKNAPGFYTGSVANMVEMARIARKVIDENDSAAVLSTPGFVNGSDRLEMFLAAGGKKYVQAVAYHFYSGDAEHFTRQLLEVRAIMKRQGIEKLPLWNTETGVNVLGPGDPPSGIAVHSQRESAEKLAQYLILGAAAGIERFYHYAWDTPHGGMLADNGERLPNMDSYEKVQAWLIGARMLGCKKVMSHGVICEGERAGARFAIAWSDSAGSYSIPAPTGWEAVSVEHLLDKSASPFVSQNQAKSDKIELSPQPLYIQYKLR